MTDFTTKVNGVPCVCRVLNYRPADVPRMGGAMEDADEPSPAEFDFELHKVDGIGRLEWLEAKMTDADIDLIADEYELHITAIKHLMDDFD